MIVDSHVHLWRLADRPQPWINPETMVRINRDFTVEDLRSTIDGLPVERVVLVQVLNQEDETEDYLKIAASTPLVAGVVGWVDLASSDLASRLDSLGGDLLGIRHQAQAEPDPVAWISRPEVTRGFRVLGGRGLVAELMMAAHQLDATEQVVVRCPDTQFVLNHAGKPPLVQGWESEACRRWAASITRLAGLGNVVCKLSGLTTMARLDSWVPGDLTPAVDHLLETFGPSRLLFGSDWPNSLRAADYPRTLDAVLTNLRQLSDQERHAILLANAERVYRTY
ncbi:L-fuconolactonase [Kribbella sp. VKM Ac-2527]|uniref:L-fuconolactonase n=1 Tax=Kribbella caucasensis TaxID=2512215 RepID=A0A4R6KEJ9_9ACTN|nr:amidohydrolase family protein [Kribbella sp. VKM Ac-2527]TDO48707.1 L-fuconolactonase [Kribbella sp. VKM Ac-2527]